MQNTINTDQGIAATPLNEGSAQSGRPSQYVAYRPAWTSQSLSAMPGTSPLGGSTTNSTYPGPRPNSGRIGSGSPDSGDNLRVASTWVQQYTESNERSKRSPLPITPRQPWDGNDYPQTKSPEELLGGPGKSPPTERERVTSSTSGRPSVGLGLSTQRRNSSNSTLSYFPPQTSLDEATERHLKTRTSNSSIGGGAMSLAQQIALDERKRKAQAELARLQEDEDARLRLIDSNTSNTEAGQQPVQSEVQHVAPTPPPPYSSNVSDVKLDQDSVEPKSRSLDHVRPQEFPSKPAPEVLPPLAATEAQNEISAPQLGVQGAEQGDLKTPQASPSSGGSLFSDLDDLVSKLGSRRKASSAYAAPRSPRPQSSSKRHPATVPAVPELPSNQSFAPRFDTFELSTSDSVRRPKPKVLEAPKIHEPHPAALFELSSSDSVVRRPKSSTVTSIPKYIHTPLESPPATHFELSTSPSVIRQPKSQNFAPPHNSAPLQPPPAKHFELSTSDSVIRRPKSQNFAPLRQHSHGEDRRSHPPSTANVPQGAWFDRWQANFEANQKFDLPMVAQRHSQQ
ncbi:MAG: hypothetical protein M1835_001917 [Candelina submexicana]|nr:MAG: hypothetical protein M1835_001917 [Candelina submexicana]